MSKDLEESLRTVAKGASIIFFGLVIGRILGMFYSILLARFLGPADYGLFSIGFSLIAILATLSRFGLGGALVREIPFFREKGRIDKVLGTIRFSLKINLILSITFGVILFLLAGDIANSVFNDNGLKIVIQILSIALPITVLTTMSTVIIRAFKGAKYIVYTQDISLPLIKISFFLIFVFFGYFLYGALLTYLISMLLVGTISFYIVQKKLFRFLKTKIKPVPVGKELLAFAWPLALTGAVTLLITNTDKLIIGFFMTSADVGIYTATLTIAILISFIPLSFSFNFLPVISELCAKKKFLELSELNKSVARWMFLMTLPLCLFIIFFSEEIIDLVYGSSYTGGSTILIILATGMSISAFFGLPGKIIIGIGKTKLNLVVDTTAGLTNLFLDILLIPILGLMGAAIATAFTYFVRRTFFSIFVYHTLKIHPFSKQYLKILTSGIVAIIPIIAIIRFFSIHIVKWYILIIFPIFILSYIIILIITKCLLDEDKIMIKAIIGKLGIKLK